MTFRKRRIAFSALSAIGCLLLVLSVRSCWWRIPATAKARTFGDEQLLQLLHDRPTMNGILAPNDPIREWVIQKFNSNSLEGRIYWDHDEPISARPAESLPAYKTQPNVVRLTNSAATSGRDKWLMLVYELHNLQNAEGFENLDLLAVNGKIDRVRYSDECFSLEFKAMVQTKRFFKLHPIGGATAQSDPFYIGYMTGSDAFDVYKRMLKSNGPGEYNPLDYFGRHFDELQSRTNETWLRCRTSL